MIHGYTIPEVVQELQPKRQRTLQFSLIVRQWHQISPTMILRTRDAGRRDCREPDAHKAASSSREWIEHNGSSNTDALRNNREPGKGSQKNDLRGTPLHAHHPTFHSIDVATTCPPRLCSSPAPATKLFDDYARGAWVRGAVREYNFLSLWTCAMYVATSLSSGNSPPCSFSPF